jgi:hypothetical protein
MESFVIRIYRRSDDGQAAVVGTLEAIATGKRSAFHSEVELLSMVGADIIGTKPKRAAKAAVRSAK